MHIAVGSAPFPDTYIEETRPYLRRQPPPVHIWKQLSQGHLAPILQPKEAPYGAAEWGQATPGGLEAMALPSTPHRQNEGMPYKPISWPGQDALQARLLKQPHLLHQPCAAAFCPKRFEAI